MGHQRGVTRHQSMKDWLGSKAPGAGGGGGKFLSGWKKDGQVDTFLHTKCLPMAVWQHPIPTLVPVKNDGQEVVHVWTKKFTCHETDDVLEEMYFREVKGDPSSTRKKPPERCGICKANEWFWQQCWAWLGSHKWVETKDEDGKKSGKWVEGVWDDDGEFVAKKGKGKGIDPCARLFRFTSEADDKENKTIHVGGICGLFGRKELRDDFVAAMRASRISQKEAWTESSIVKPQSVLCVVNSDKPADGVQISVETKELGEKVKEEIVRVYKSLEVDVQRSPYCIRWEYDKDALMGKMYKATAMMKIKPSERVMQLIRGPVPDLSQLTTPFNQTSIRSVFERHCQLEKGVVPWGDFFPTKEQEKAWQDADAADEDGSPDDAERGSEDRDSDVEGSNPVDDDDADDADEMVECDACDKPMKMSAAKCPHCGEKYDVEAEAPEPEPEPEKPKPKMRSRSEAQKAKPAEPKPKAKAAPKPAREPGDDAEEDDQGDELPF